MLILTITNTSGNAYRFELDAVPGTCYRIGRSADCEIALPQEIHLSRVHCILTVGDGYALLTDNNSSNGIFENGERKQEFTMFLGQEYKIGSCAICVSAHADAVYPEPEETAPQAPDAPDEMPEPAYTDAPEPAYTETPEPTPAAEEIAETEETPEAPPYTAPVEEPASEPLPTTTAQQEEESAPLPPADIEEVETVAEPPRPKPRKFIPPPPRKALVKRPAPRPVLTAAGTLNTQTQLPAPKALKQRHRPDEPKIQRAPSESAEALGLPGDFGLSLRLLNTTATLPEGDLLQFAVEAEEDCHLYLIQYDCEGHAAMLLPGVGGAQNRIRANTKAIFPPPGNNTDYEIFVEQPYGEDLILAIACTAACPFPKIWQQCAAEADKLSPRGETEQKAITFCNELRGMASARWSAAILRIRTGTEF